LRDCGAQLDDHRPPRMASCPCSSAALLLPQRCPVGALMPGLATRPAYPRRVGLRLDALNAVVASARNDIPELLARENLRPATKWVIGTSLPIAARAALHGHIPGSYEAVNYILERRFGLGVGGIGKKVLARFDP
jgi:hypothetical protein